MTSVAAFVAALALTVPPALVTPQVTAGAGPTPPPIVYVALGDSFSSGAGIPPNLALTGCLRSGANYPHLIAQALPAARFRDVTCSGATTAHLTGRQLPTVPAQFDALTPDTTLVTVGIGANDVGLVSLAVACLNVAPPPFGVSCAADPATGPDTYTPRVDRLASTYGALVDEIRRRAPLARTVLVGYPTTIRAGGCPGVQPIWPEDADYIQSLVTRVNATMAGTAGVTFVDLEPSTHGHDACATPAERWVEGAVPVSLAAPIPLHPNAAGHANAAAQILAALTR